MNELEGFYDFKREIETKTGPTADFPRHVHKAHGQYKEVANEAEFKAAIKDGWSEKQVFQGDETVWPEGKKK